MGLYNEYLTWSSEGLVSKDLAKEVVFRIISDFTNRRGLRQEFEGCDDEIKDEMIQEWIDSTNTVILDFRPLTKRTPEVDNANQSN